MEEWILSLVLLGITSLIQGQYNYHEVLHKSILFYEAQRSGDLPTSNRISYRGDSALNDRGNGGEDLTGGWYDAGDHVKFNFPMAWSTTTLAWGILEFAGGYQAAGEYDVVLDSIRWPLDYFLKCHVSSGNLYGQVGDGDTDHAYWGRPEEMTMERPAWSLNAGAPGSDLAGETAAALAAGSMVFRASDAAYADRLLSAARDIYTFAYNYRGLYSDSIQDAGAFYRSGGYNDELAWGAAWLYWATGEAGYLNQALEFADMSVAWAYSWDSKIVGYQLLLAAHGGQAQFTTPVDQFIASWLPTGGITYTPLGLAWRDMWGCLRYSASSSFIALVAARHGIRVDDGRNFAVQQIHYMLGDTGHSYVVGYGINPPTQPHHRSSSCPDEPAPCGDAEYQSPNANPQILEGALVGGPDQQDNYVDERSNYVTNEVACDYNAGFQGALAGLIVGW